MSFMPLPWDHPFNRILNPGSVFGRPGGGIFPQEGGGLFGGITERLTAPQAQLGLQLLANSGPSRERRGFGQILGQSALGVQQAQAQQQDNDLRRQYMQAQIEQMQRPRDTGPLVPIQRDGQTVYGTRDQAVGQAVPLDGTADRPTAIEESEYYEQLLKTDPERAKRFLTLKRQPTAPQVVWFNGAPHLVDRFSADATPLSTQERELEAARRTKGAEAAGKAESERFAAHIDTGLQAADSLATVKRGINLLEEVKTGGFHAVKLKATNIFGVTGADEAELSANLGKAVLSQLRATFGAQFTEKEGQRLAEIEAGFGKSTEGNKRLLEQAQRILERAARRGIHSAEKLKDEFSAQEIRDAMGFTLDPQPSAGNAPAAAIEHLKRNPQLKEQFRAKYGYVPDGI